MARRGSHQVLRWIMSLRRLDNDHFKTILRRLQFTFLQRLEVTLIEVELLRLWLITRRVIGRMFRIQVFALVEKLSGLLATFVFDNRAVMVLLVNRRFLVCGWNVDYRLRLLSVGLWYELNDISLSAASDGLSLVSVVKAVYTFNAFASSLGSHVVQA